MKFCILSLFFFLPTILFAQVEELEMSALPFQLTIQPMQKEIQAFKGNGQEHLIYELILSNLSQNSLRLTAIHIAGKKCRCSANSDLFCLKFKKRASSLNACKTIYEQIIQQDELPSLFSLLNAPVHSVPQDPVVPPNESAVLFLFLDFPSRKQIPDFLENSLNIEIDGHPETRQTLLSSPILVNKRPPLVIQPPLEGKNWFAEAAPSNSNHHRRAIIVINGKALIPERFAVDFIQYGPEGLSAGDPFDNRSYYSYGQKIFSVANGTVIRVLDGIPDHPPGSVPPLTNPETIGGNYVLMKIDPNHYAFYAHLIPGSIQVKKGDKVKAGQLLGLLGNSGNTDLPHLHFQITTKPGPLGDLPLPYPLNAQGIPWVFDRFIREDYIPIGQNPIGPNLPMLVEPLGGRKVCRQIVIDRNLASFRERL